MTIEFRRHDLIADHYLADAPAELPFHVLVAFPDYVTRDPAAPVFNLPGAMSALLGRFGWERARHVLRPWIWAPSWSDEEVERLARSPYGDRAELFDGISAAQLRAPDFPGTAGLLDPTRPGVSRYDVVHVVGSIEWRRGERSLIVAEGLDLWLDAAALRRATRATRTRLLIIHAPSAQRDEAAEFAASVADHGGPATVLVTSPVPGASDAYLLDVVAGLLHNETLADLVAPRLSARADDLTLHVDLYAPARSDDVLRLDRWLAALEERSEQLRLAVEDLPPVAADRLAGLDRYLHREQIEQARARATEVATRLTDVEAEARRIFQSLRSDLDWAHESSGAEPLSRLHGSLLDLERRLDEAADLYPEVEREAEAATRSPVRVLNANFADPDGRRVIAPQEPLLAGRAYDLLVDIGPRWSSIPTIVRGHDAFPEESLPPSAEGHVIDAVLISDDLAPRTIGAQLWLPAERGRSHPYVDGAPADAAGPVRLGFTVPAGGGPPGERRQARGRLLLYHGNDLLQSAVVTASVLREPDPAAAAPVPAAVLDAGETNEVRVDFAQTAAFRDVGPELGRRSIRLHGEDAEGHHEIRLGIAVNDDGRGSHRIVVRQGDGLPPAWAAYDPSAAGHSLRAARGVLRDCFGSRDDRAEPVGDDAAGVRRGDAVRGLNRDNGKSRRQFLLDLFALAKVGSRLYAELVTLLRPGTGTQDTIAWERALRRTLATAGVIQVARMSTTPDNYSFPWALLYEYPLFGDSTRWRWCDVLTSEWSREGLRDRPIAAQCPHATEAWHAENVLCPYGFWGFKHVIEQPLAPVDPTSPDVPAGAADMIRYRDEIHLGVGWTRDPELDLVRIEDHVARVAGHRGIRLAGPPPNPADDLEGVGAAVIGADLVYFICHCEADPRANESYLSIGPRDGAADHRVYGSTINAWARTDRLARWATTRPLVIINGCNTGDLEPGAVLALVSQFGLARAGGIVATEVAMQVGLAAEVAERLIGKLVASPGTGLGQALREVRWELLDKGNALGLCYTAYGRADLGFVRA